MIHFDRSRTALTRDICTGNFRLRPVRGTKSGDFVPLIGDASPVSFSMSNHDVGKRVFVPGNSKMPVRLRLLAFETPNRRGEIS
jgi:hypothetical protein